MGSAGRLDERAAIVLDIHLSMSKENTSGKAVIMTDAKGLSETCFACGRKLGKHPKMVDTMDGQTVWVGSECYRLVLDAGENGYEPPGWKPGYVKLYLVGGAPT